MDRKAMAKRRGLTLIDAARVLLECNECGERWQPLLGYGGRLLRGWWRCPNGCNWPAVGKAV